MTVKDILAAKGSDVATIEPSADLATAAKMLVARRIGALLVLGPDRRVAGILSERDIVRALAEGGGAALEQQVSAVMTRMVVSCTPTDTLNGLMELMTTGKFRHLPVLVENQLVGLISIGDVVKWRLQELEQEQAELRDYIRTA